MITPARRTLLEFVLIFLLAAVLIWPLFKIKYMEHWDSIEATFIADARFLKENWPHPNWQPLWYGGTRFDFVYPPALRYGTAALAKFYPMTEVRAYHIYTAFFFCIGIAAVYLFMYTISGSRTAGWLAAAATALLSPSFLFLKEMRIDSGWLVPQRIGVLVRYGEGPHMTALALLPLALALSFRALERWRPASLAAAGVLSALVVSNNFYGATALALCFPVILWAVWITRLDRGIWMRAAGIVALAYGLTAFWLVPAYFEVTLNNLKLVAEPGNSWSIWVWLAAWVAFLTGSERWARGRVDRISAVITWGLFVFFAIIVLGHYYLNFRVIGEPTRLVPELDLAIILFAAETLRWLWSRAPDVRAARIALRTIAVAAVVVGFSTTFDWVSQSRKLFPRALNHMDRIEFKIPDWIAKNYPASRALATGSVRFWYTAWHSLAQMGGGSEQGLINHTINLAYLRVMLDESAERAIHWMQTFGVDLVIVHDQRSQELYKDFVNPRKFDGAMPVVYDNGAGDAIYLVPRRWRSLARAVETERIKGIPYRRAELDPEVLRRYAETLEKGPDAPTSTEWQGADALRVRAPVSAGQSIVVLITYDPAWRAYSAGRSLRTGRDVMGQTLIEAPPGDHDIRLVFETPRQVKLGRALTALSVVAVATLVFLAVRRRGTPA
ncbi:MAG: hypothetical protein ACRD8O_09710 [Bryobacteraceae bacterium]